jgi:hypothetical protein
MIQKPWIEIIGACRTSLTGYTSTASVVFGGEGRCMESSITYIRFWDSQAENGSHSSRRNHSELVRLTVWLSARSLLVHALRFSIMTQCMLNSIQMVLRSYKQNSIHDTDIMSMTANRAQVLGQTKRNRTIESILRLPRNQLRGFDFWKKVQNSGYTYGSLRTTLGEAGEVKAAASRGRNWSKSASFTRKR